MIRSCPTYPGYYATDLGEVLSARTRRGVPGKRGGSTSFIDPSRLKPKASTTTKKGYKYVTLRKNGKLLPVGVHTLVLDAFVAPRPPGQECRHLNNDPSDNRVANLAWGTPKENAADRLKAGTYLRGKAHPMAKLTEQDVGEIKRLRSDRVKVKQIAGRFGVSVSSIEAVIYGKLWKHVV